MTHGYRDQPVQAPDHLRRHMRIYAMPIAGVITCICAAIIFVGFHFTSDMGGGWRTLFFFTGLAWTIILVMHAGSVWFYNEHKESKKPLHKTLLVFSGMLAVAGALSIAVFFCQARGFYGADAPKWTIGITIASSFALVINLWPLFALLRYLHHYDDGYRYQHPSDRRKDQHRRYSSDSSR